MNAALGEGAADLMGLSLLEFGGEAHAAWHSASYRKYR